MWMTGKLRSLNLRIGSVTMRKIFFRADGNAKMGLGHVIRSLALADMLKDQFHCEFIIRNPHDSLKRQIKELCHTIHVIPETTADLKEVEFIANNLLSGDEIVVLDGYHFRTEYQNAIKRNGAKLVCIDDIYEYHFYADVIINHAGGVSKEHYSKEAHTQVCLGPEYALLRKPFRDLANNSIAYPKGEHHVFICLGGADPKNDTLKVLQACENLDPRYTYHVVTGSAYQYKVELKEYVGQSPLSIHHYSNLSALEMAKTMAKCASAITSPSGIAYEYLSTGGTLFLVKIADNQNGPYNYYLKNKVARDFYQELELSSKTNGFPISFLGYSTKSKLIDGQQSKRYMRLFQALTLSVRPANETECLLYYEWANDPDVRRQSYSSHDISFDEHEKWFFEKILDKDYRMFVVEKAGKAIGQIRFSLNAGIATISYGLDKNYRGQGLGVSLLRIGCSELKKEIANIQIIGFVKKSNIPSSKAFEEIGSFKEEAKEYKDSFKYTILAL